MRAMQLIAPGKALEPAERQRGRPGRGQILLRVSTCGVCRTGLLGGAAVRVTNPAR